MNYRHAYHAGNFADVHKHVALTAILSHLRRKKKPFVVIDTHAGRGLYDLSGVEAAKTAEAADGIGRLEGYAPQNAALQAYLEIVRSFRAQQYPGSPLIAAQLLRPQDRLVAIEKQLDEIAALRAALAPFPTARAIDGDGYAQLRALLPPPERRGLMLIDPPYEDADEMERMANAFRDAYRRFATGIYLLWYPLKLASRIEAFAGELKVQAPIKLLSLRIDIDAPKNAMEDRLSAAGLLVANPPFGFDEEMRAASAELLPLLRGGASARTTGEWLAGGP
jgi:23S rRNA (adenine2030-N6)-methyltransferase